MCRYDVVAIVPIYNISLIASIFSIGTQLCTYQVTALKCRAPSHVPNLCANQSQGKLNKLISFFNDTSKLCCYTYYFRQGNAIENDDYIIVPALGVAWRGVGSQGIGARNVGSPAIRLKA